MVVIAMKIETYERLIDRFNEMLRIMFFMVIFGLLIFFIISMTFFVSGIGSYFSSVGLSWLDSVWFGALVSTILSFFPSMVLYYYIVARSTYSSVRLRDFWKAMATEIILDSVNAGKERKIEKWLATTPKSLCCKESSTRYLFLSTADAIAFKLIWDGNDE